MILCLKNRCIVMFFIDNQLFIVFTMIVFIHVETP